MECWGLSKSQVHKNENGVRMFYWSFCLPFGASFPSKNPPPICLCSCPVIAMPPDGITWSTNWKKWIAYYGIHEKPSPQSGRVPHKVAMTCYINICRPSRGFLSCETALQPLVVTIKKWNTHPVMEASSYSLGVNPDLPFPSLAVPTLASVVPSI